MSNNLKKCLNFLDGAIGHMVKIVKLAIKPVGLVVFLACYVSAFPGQMPDALSGNGTIVGVR